MSITRDEYLKPATPVYKDVPLPDRGEDVSIRVKGLNAKEWSQYELSMLDESGRKTPAKSREARARLIAMAAVNADGSRMFSMQDVPLIQEQLIGEVEVICDAIWEASGRFSVGNSPPTTDEEPLSD
jgi:hypothetical protein